MQISKETIEVLESLALVNSAIIIKPGNRLVSWSNSGGVLANAAIKDQFDADFGVYDLKTFLSMISLVGDEVFLDTSNSAPDLGAFVLIKNDANNPSVKYKFYVAEQSLIKSPPKDELEIVNTDLSFDLNAQTLKRLLQAAAVLGLENIAIVSDTNDLYIQTADPKQKNTDSFSLKVSDSYDGPAINILVAKEKMTFLSGDYTCQVSFKPLLLQFTNKTRDLRYWVAPEVKSTVETK